MNPLIPFEEKLVGFLGFDRYEQFLTIVDDYLTLKPKTQHKVLFANSFIRIPELDFAIKEDSVYFVELNLRMQTNPYGSIQVKVDAPKNVQIMYNTSPYSSVVAPRHIHKIFNGNTFNFYLIQEKLAWIIIVPYTNGDVKISVNSNRTPASLSKQTTMRVWEIPNV